MMNPVPSGTSLGIAPRAFHDARLAWFEGEGERQSDSGNHIDPQNLHGTDAQNPAESDRDKNNKCLRSAQSFPDFVTSLGFFSL